MTPITAQDFWCPWPRSIYTERSTKEKIIVVSEIIEPPKDKIREGNESK